MEVTFKARARTLDMLGRQQIAGVPTAISELFKNAHDAYAERVEVDYYRRDGLFVLRDDGSGMGRDEFVDRWLTIATETSVTRKRAESRLPKSAKRARPVLGEKGIGRLAIATIAPQVLVLTRARSDGALSELTAAFLNWQVFECPELNLQDIRIPLQTFPGGTLPSGEDVANMVGYFQSRNEHLRERVDGSEWERIETELSQFKVDPQTMAEHLGEPTLLGNGHGTHFYLLPTSRIWNTTSPGIRTRTWHHRCRRHSWGSPLPHLQMAENQSSEPPFGTTGRMVSAKTSSEKASSSQATSTRTPITGSGDDSTSTASSRAACPCTARLWMTT